MTSPARTFQATNSGTTALPVTATDIEAAAERIEGVAARTPLQRNQRLSNASGGHVWLKREDLQPVRSYKIRGAYNLISQLSDEQRAKGVICASAGNHGQGVAVACAALGIRGTIYVPSTTPSQKKERMKALGQGFVDLVVTGATYDDSSDAGKAAAAESGAVLVPAFDDVRTIAGQGTVAHEIVEQLGGAPDWVIVPVGGGGMLAGVAAWFAERAPETRVLGVEPESAACMIAALEAGRPVTLQNIDTFVDGAAVKRSGDITYAMTDALAPEMMSIPEGQICSEMLALYQVDGIIAEPAGAMASAALANWQPAAGETVVAIVSGGNNDVLRYAEVVERSLIFEGRKHYFLINFPQEPGALRRFLDDVLGPNDDITYFEYVKRNNRERGPALVGIELSHRDDLAGLKQRMDLSDIECEFIDPEGVMFRFINS